ncbi:MAG: type 4a pilus biogenesis protein PilO, partial [Nitrospinales bacterium]
MNWLFDRLPYDRLGDFKFAHFLLAGLGMGFLLFILYFFTLYNINNEKYTLLQTKKSQTEQKLVNYRNLIAEKDDVSTRLVTLQGQLDLEKKQIPKGKDIPGILRRAADIGNYLGLDILLFQVKKGKDMDYYKEIPIEIKVRGGFYNTSGFLDAMQNLLQLVDV